MIHEKRTGKCSFCGKRMTLSRTFDGEPGSSAAVRAEQAERDAREWAPAFVHQRCQSQQVLPGQTDIWDFI